MSETTAVIFDLVERISLRNNQIQAEEKTTELRNQAIRELSRCFGDNPVIHNYLKNVLLIATSSPEISGVKCLIAFVASLKPPFISDGIYEDILDDVDIEHLQEEISKLEQCRSSQYMSWLHFSHRLKQFDCDKEYSKEMFIHAARIIIMIRATRAA